MVPSLADFDSDARSTAGSERFDSLFSKTPAQAQAQTATNSSHGIMFEDGKPSSKTSLGKVYYKLGKLPYLLLIDVDITTTEPAKGEDGEPVLDKNGVSVTQPTMVRSRRLRQQALEEYVEIGSEGLSVKHSEIAFDLEARSNQLDAVQKVWPGIGQCSERPRFGRTNRLIIPVRGKLDVEKVFNKFDQIKGLTRANKTYSKAGKRADPKNTGWPIRCTVVRQGLLAHPDIKRSDAPILLGSEHSEDTNATDESTEDRIVARTESRDDSSDESENRATDQAKEPSEPDESRISEEEMNQDAATALYRHSIQLLFQHHWDSAYPTARLGNTSEFRFTNADLFGQEKIPLIDKSDRHIHLDAPWEYRIRYRPRFDKDLRLFFDYDLVPIIQNGVSVAEYAGYHFPANRPTAPASMSQTLKRLLQGLHVRYPLDIKLKGNYENIAKANQWKLIGHVDDQKEHKELQDRTCTIRDVKANSDVGLVIPVTKLVSGGGEEKTFLNVKKFLSVCGAPSEARYKHLPLADIGKNRPFWVPLDLLVFSVDQVLPHLQHLTDELQRLRKSLNPYEISASGSKLLNILRTDPMVSQNRSIAGLEGANMRIEKPEDMRV
ncbi:hypothetical protein SLS60_001456 [Paraconiothyrium brasiliense]|uniref:Uncharacterized protein n=1 Tax=Paraconiothyrium brasiliense TaxID=300254 RepID=A0ABR3S971_9PLEO